MRKDSMHTTTLEPVNKFLVFLGYLPFLFALAGLWLVVAADNHSLALLTVPFLTYVYAAMRRNYIVGYAKTVRLHNLWALLDKLSFKSEVRPFKNMQVNLLGVVADVLLIPLLCWGGPASDCGACVLL